MPGDSRWGALPHGPCRARHSYDNPTTLPRPAAGKGWSMAEVAVPGVLSVTETAGWQAYRRDAERYFRWSVGLTAVITAVWLFFVVTGRDGGAIFKGYQLNLEAVGRVAMGFLVMSDLWGWLWYGIKSLLLRKLAGFSKEEVRAVFRSRMSEPFDL